MTNVISGTTEDGEDFQEIDFRGDVLADLRSRQEAIWAVVSQGYR